MRRIAGHLPRHNLGHAHNYAHSINKQRKKLLLFCSLSDRNFSSIKVLLEGEGEVVLAI